MKFFCLNGSPIAAPDSHASRSFVFTTKNAVVDRVCAFGNAGTPIADKTINVPENGLLFINVNAQIGILDIKPPILRIKDGSTVLAEIVMTFFPESFVFDSIPSGNKTISVDMADIVDGGCGYIAATIIGGLS